LGFDDAEQVAHPEIEIRRMETKTFGVALGDDLLHVLRVAHGTARIGGTFEVEARITLRERRVVGQIRGVAQLSLPFDD
jgi:hypothetical protein